MAAPFQARQYTDPRIGVLQNVYDAQEARDLQSQQLRNKTLNNAMGIGGALFQDYLGRKSDRDEGRFLLERMGANPEDVEGRNITADTITDYMQTQVNAANYNQGMLDNLAESLQFLPRNQQAAAAQRLYNATAGLPVINFRGLAGTGGGQPGTVQPAQGTFASNLGTGMGLPAPVQTQPVTIQPGEQPVSEEDGTLPNTGFRPINAVDVDTRKQQMIDASMDNSAFGMEMDKAVFQTEREGSKAVSDEAKAKQDLRKQNELQFFSQMPRDQMVSRFGEKLPFQPDTPYKSKVDQLNTAAKLDDSTALRELLTEAKQGENFFNDFLLGGERILGIYSQEGFKDAPRTGVEALARSAVSVPQSLGRMAFNVGEDIGFSQPKSNEELNAAFDIYTNKTAKVLAQSLESGRLSDFDFQKALEQVGNIGLTPEAFRQKFFENANRLMVDQVNNQYALGNADIAEQMKSRFIRLAQNVGGKIVMRADGVPQALFDFDPEEGDPRVPEYRFDINQGQLEDRGTTMRPNLNNFDLMSPQDLMNIDPDQLSPDQLDAYIDAAERAKGGQ